MIPKSKFSSKTGGEEPALSDIKQAIECRKHIVTANKEVLAKHDPSCSKWHATRGRYDSSKQA